MRDATADTHFLVVKTRQKKQGNHSVTQHRIQQEATRIREDGKTQQTSLLSHETHLTGKN